VGGVVVTKRVPVSSLHVRDVIVFHRPGIPDELVVHRIVSLRQVAGGGVVIRTQGDNNPVKDPWEVTLSGTTAYQAVFSVPLLGYVSVWWHQPQTRLVALLLAIACALGAGLSLLWSRRSSGTDPPTTADHPAPDGAPSSQTQDEAELGV
jgi:signal peptidase I